MFASPLSVIVSRFSLIPSDTRTHNGPTCSITHTGEKLVNMPNYIFKMMKTKEEAPDNCVTFKVPLNVNKPIIKNYLEEIYNVKIAKVNTQVYLGKVKRWRNGSFYKLKDWKKAIVFLENEEDAIEFPKLDELNEQYDKSRVEHKHVLK